MPIAPCWQIPKTFLSVGAFSVPGPIHVTKQYSSKALLLGISPPLLTSQSLNFFLFTVPHGASLTPHAVFACLQPELFGGGTMYLTKKYYLSVLFFNSRIFFCLKVPVDWFKDLTLTCLAPFKAEIHNSFFASHYCSYHFSMQEHT